MEFQREIIVGVGPLRHEQLPESTHFYVEIILIDKSQAAMHPLLYQLKQDALENERYDKSRNLINLHSGSFLMIGELVSVDKKNKLIYFSHPTDGPLSQHTIAYKHLIVMSGLTHSLTGLEQAEHFCKGVQTFLEAERIRNKISEQPLQPDLQIVSMGGKSRSASRKKPGKSAAMKTLQQLLNQNQASSSEPPPPLKDKPLFELYY